MWAGLSGAASRRIARPTYSGHLSAKEDIMRYLILAVFSIAVLAIVGCDSDTAESQKGKGAVESNREMGLNPTSMEESLSESEPEPALNPTSVEEARSSEYDFRQSRWGDSREKVMLSERGFTLTDSGMGRTLHYRSTLKSILMPNEPEITPQKFVDALKYKSALESIPVGLVYYFDINKNRLHEATYSIELTADDVKFLTEYALELHGEPTLLSVSDGSMTWLTNRSWIQLYVYDRYTNDLYWNVTWRYSAND